MNTVTPYAPEVRTPNGMQPLLRPAMSAICDVCGKSRTTVLDLMTEIASLRYKNTEGCKPDLINQTINEINSDDIQRLLKSIGTLIPYAEAEASKRAAREMQRKDWTQLRMRAHCWMRLTEKMV